MMDNGNYLLKLAGSRRSLYCVPAHQLSSHHIITLATRSLPCCHLIYTATYCAYPQLVTPVINERQVHTIANVSVIIL